MKKVNAIFIQAMKFFGISGIGWLIDFSIFAILHRFVGNRLVWGLGVFKLDACNMISMLCGVTFVFFVSTKKTFNVKLKKLSVKKKYMVYIGYQFVMMMISSLIVGAFINMFIVLDGSTAVISNAILADSILQKGLLFILKPEISAKICVTPITMICNFLFMKFLLEKI